MKITIFVILALLVPSMAIAAIYRCNIAGQVVFTDIPCPKETTSHTVQLSTTPRETALTFCRKKYPYAAPRGLDACTEEQLAAKKSLESQQHFEHAEIVSACINNNPDDYIEAENCFIEVKSTQERALAEKLRHEAVIHENKLRVEAAENKERQYEKLKAAKLIEAKIRGMYVIEYVVEGTTTRASLTYINASGGTEQKTVSVPWRQMYIVDKKASAYIAAQNLSKYSDKISVKILINDIVVKESTSSGEYSIASASL